MTNRKFNEDAFKENDPESRRKAMTILRSVGWEVRENEDKYGVDLMVMVPFELERRPFWKGPLFPFDTVHIPYRKKKFFDKGPGMYGVLNEDYSYMLVCDFRVITECPLVTLKPRTGDDMEVFYNVPLEAWEIADILC